ncbi:hypothetical protein ANAPC1_00707 [Anaplasma phagocytophilum]|uniref:Uncharacterized protein n=1 Tax=Anaplasma phagocytophilum TaxID=948 RepID=A0AA45UT50_ANAPH|nr:hypothetical protein ANAPC1_00707 [Anaplasma phagocytophilum]SBO33289.1 hypothetical protein ANAPC2_01311 [Anaplasma phagocytophilum]
MHKVLQWIFVTDLFYKKESIFFMHTHTPFRTIEKHLLNCSILVLFYIPYLNLMKKIYSFSRLLIFYPFSYPYALYILPPMEASFFNSSMVSVIFLLPEALTNIFS